MMFIGKEKDFEQKRMLLEGRFSLSEVGELYQQSVKSSNIRKRYLGWYKGLSLAIGLGLIGGISVGIYIFRQYRYLPAVRPIFPAGFLRWVLLIGVILLILQLFALVGDYLIARGHHNLLESIKIGYPRLNKIAIIGQEIDSKFALSCESCGGNLFHEKYKRGRVHFRCRYCGEELNLSKEMEKSFRKLVVMPPRFLSLRIALVVLTFLTVLGYGIGYGVEYSRIDNSRIGLEKIALIDSWDRELFKSIEVAEKVFRGLVIEDFVGGSQIDELLVVVGEPNQRMDYDRNYREKVELTWHSPIHPENMSKVVVVYLVDTRQIIAKEVFGR